MTGKTVVPKRNPLAVLADFQAFQRFTEMNTSQGATEWSRNHEYRLRSKLTDELGEVFKQLQLISLILPRHEDRESPSLAILTAALKKSSVRDRPSSMPADEVDFS